MKKTRLFLAITAFTGIILSCHNTIELIPPSSQGHGSSSVSAESDKVYISLTLHNGAEEIRTAMPVVQWGEYYYTLKGKYAPTVEGLSTAEEGLLVPKQPFSVFDQGNRLPLTRGYYIFTLTGYKDDTPVIEGISAITDLTSGGRTVPFRMFAKEGSKGNAKITVFFPASVTKVSAWHSTNFLGSEGKDKEKDFTDFSDGTNKIEYSLTDLPSGIPQYAQFRFYDNEGSLIASRSESIIVVGDESKLSESTLIITMDSLHTYNVSVSLQQNGNDWIYSNQEIVLKDKTTGKEYILIDKDGDGIYDGTFTGTAAEGIFEIYIKKEGSDEKTDIGLEFNTSEEQKTINFVTVTTPTDGGVQFTPDFPLSGGIPGSETNQYLIPEGGSGIEFTVEPKPGYTAANGGITINGSVPADINQEKPGVQIKLDSASAGTKITTGGTSVIVYTISYDLAGGKWASGYPAPTSYTVENYTTVNLPKYGDLTLAGGKTFDGWRDAGGAKFAALKEGQTGNLTLTALWKDGIAMDVGKDSDSITEKEKNEYPDIKGKIFACGFSLIINWKEGKPSTGKTEVYYDYNSDGEINGDDKLVDDYQDFTDFKLMAGTKDGDQPASDFKFTVLGGKLAGLEGLGKDKLNTSTVNISGNSTQIGNEKTGIILESLTNECVNVTGRMSGDYSNTLVSSHKYEANHGYYKVAYINNPSYAQLGKFKCLYKADDSDLLLSIMDQDQGTSKVIYLANPNPIALPPSLGTPGENVDGGVLWLEISDNVYSKTDFTLGDTTTISIPCSVFSIAVSNGTFSLTSTEMKDDTGNTLATDNLGQTSDGYSTELSDDTEYIYLHMFSKSNQITAARATEFLKKVIFKKASETEEIKISINLETVPYELITAVDPTLENFKYYDGSFYLNVNESVTWDVAYQNAKSTIFNGMNGYLMTITSEVENIYIFKQLKASMAWTGGCRMKASEGYDKNEYSFSSTDESEFIWQCGPEAGKIYWTGKTTKDGAKCPEGMYALWGKVSGLFGISTAEPSGGNENCMQFYSDGKWNDVKYNIKDDKNANKNFIPQSYVVEFRPYETIYGTQKANYQSVSLDASY